MASSPEEFAPPATSPPQSSTTKPFRFKTARQNSRSRSRSPTSSRSHLPRRHHHRHHHHHRSRRRPENPPSPHLDPDTAFRESLFDAMADDEGAAYWEGVYGQPIHTYSPYTAPEYEDPDNPRLERMSDEEYVSYVRGKMWEKSHAYVVEERRRREEERQKKKERERVAGEEGERWERGVEEALKRGEERRRGKRWGVVWERYTKGWKDVRLDISDGGEGGLKERVVWPVESGSWRDVRREEVEKFYKFAPTGGNVKGVDLGEVLKKERVRWHPDKMQQRAGEGGIDEETLKVVTAVFQVIDKLWSETKGKA